MLGTLVLLIGAIALVFGSFYVSTRQPTQSTSTGTYASFSGPVNVFDIFKRDTTNAPTVIQQQNETPSEQIQAIQSIIDAWDSRVGSSQARAAQANITELEKAAAKETERQEIADIFNDLIGDTKFTDKLAQQSGYNSGSGGTNVADEDIWLGGYSGSGTTVTQTQMTPTQEALHTYGNELGATLTTFNTVQGDQVGLLENFVEDRAQTASLKQLTDAYTQLSSDIDAIDAPAMVASTHQKLVTSYRQVGELLWDTAGAQDDEEFVQRILAYNKASEEVAKGHVALVTLFKAYGVEFKDGEPGSIFVFTPPF